MIVIMMLSDNKTVKTITLNVAIAFAIASIVDFAYSYVVMEDISQIIAKHLMLDKDVQKEILKIDKIDEILEVALESKVGKKLAVAIKKSMIDKIASESDIFVMDGAHYSFILRDSDFESLIGIEMTSLFN